MQSLKSLTTSQTTTTLTHSVRRAHCMLNDIKSGLDLLKKYAEAIYPGFIIDQNNENAITQLIWYFNGDEKFTINNYPGDINKGVLLIGKPGTGKSLMMRIFAEYIKFDDLFFFSEGKRISMQYDIKACNDIVNEFENSGHDVAANYARRRIICFDDLGEEKKEAVYFGSRENVMQTLIERRYQNSVITLATTNFNIDSLGEMYGARVKSRIYEMFNIMILPGTDRRIV